jgi:hypothetical protein
MPSRRSRNAAASLCAISTSQRRSSAVDDVRRALQRLSSRSQADGSDAVLDLSCMNAEEGEWLAIIAAIAAAGSSVAELDLTGAVLPASVIHALEVAIASNGHITARPGLARPGSTVCGTCSGGRG